MDESNTSLNKGPSIRFKENVQGMSGVVKFIITNFAPDIINSLVLSIAINYIQKMDPIDLIEKFISKSYEYWCKIKEKDEKFFIDVADKIFGNLPSGDVNMFKNIFILKKDNGDPLIGDEYKDILWNYFHANVRISLSYLSETKSYKRLTPGIDIDSVSKLWSQN